MSSTRAKSELITSLTELYIPPALITIINLSVIVLTIVFSAGKTERHLYDVSLISWKTTVIPVTNLPKVAKFYTDVLDFARVERARELLPTQAAFRIGNKRSIILEYSDVEDSGGQRAVIRVRNGFLPLHEELIKRTDKNEFEVKNYETAVREIPQSSVSSIHKGPFGEQFIVRDTERNIFVYFKHSPSNRW